MKVLTIFCLALTVACLILIGINTHNIEEIKKVNFLQDSLIYQGFDTSYKKAFLVNLTTYNNVISQTDNTPNITASNLKIKKSSKFVALSRDLLQFFNYGDIIEIQNAKEYNGIYVVADCMNTRFYRAIDILIKNNKHTSLKNVVIKEYDNQ